MKFTNDGVNWSSPVSYAGTKAWTLSAGGGTKTVYARFMDAAGNWSMVYSDTITLLPETYGPWQSGFCWYDDPESCWSSGIDTCDGNHWASYTCPSGTTKTCNDVADYLEDYEYDEWYYRTVTCYSSQQYLYISKGGTGAGTVTSSPSGISCGTDCLEYYPSGPYTVTLAATAAAGSSFAGWSGGGCSGTGTTCTLTMNANTTVTATFNSSGCTPPTYGPWQSAFCNYDDPESCWDSWFDTCNGDNGSAYTCPSGTAKTCNDTADYFEEWDHDEWNYRTVTCRTCP